MPTPRVSSLRSELQRLSRAVQLPVSHSLCGSQSAGELRSLPTVPTATHVIDPAGKWINRPFPSPGGSPLNTESAALMREVAWCIETPCVAWPHLDAQEVRVRPSLRVVQPHQPHNIASGLQVRASEDGH